MPPFDGDSTLIAQPPSAARIAGRYEPRDRLGAGAMGQVFEAYDHRLRRLVALKLIPLDRNAAEARRRFQLEARAVARLRHPGIVAVHDVGEGPDFAWIAMELVIGHTLRAQLDCERPSLAETIRIITALLDALGHAHARGVVHRDVKPANILLGVGLEAHWGEVRLADFGIAIAGGSLGGGEIAGEIIGTPGVMAPEQWRGEPACPQADLWAVGVILYEMLTGRRPFAGCMPGLADAVLHSQPLPPCALLPGLPPGLDGVVARALSKDRQGRFADAATMADALLAAQAPAPHAPQPTQPFSASPQGKNWRWMLAALLGCVVGRA